MINIEDGDSLWAQLGKLVGAFAIGALLSVWQGYAVAKLWGWFVVPAFSAPTLSLGYAVGLLTLWRMFRRTSDAGSSYDQQIPMAIMAPAVALLVGWVTLLCMGSP